MIDWVAIGSIGTVAAAVIAYAQWRSHQSNKKSLSSEEYHTSITTSSRLVDQRIQDAPTLNYQADYITSRYPIDVSDLPDELAEIKKNMAKIHAITLYIQNRNNFPLRDVQLRVPLSASAWSVEVEKCSTLAGEAVQLDRQAKSLRIAAQSLPAGESVKIAIFTPDLPWEATTLKSENANVQVKRYF